MREWGFRQCRYNPCVFTHYEKGIRCLVHGDDFVCLAATDQLEWMRERLRARFEVKTSMIGRKEAGGEAQEARILNRVIRVTQNGWEYEADQRHCDLIIRETGADKLSGLTHPGGDKKVVAEEGEVTRTARQCSHKVQSGSSQGELLGR